MKKIAVNPAKYSSAIAVPSAYERNRNSARRTIGDRARRSHAANTAMSARPARTSSHFRSLSHCCSWTSGSSTHTTPAPSSSTPSGSRPWRSP